MLRRPLFLGSAIIHLTLLAACRPVPPRVDLSSTTFPPPSDATWRHGHQLHTIGDTAVIIGGSPRAGAPSHRRHSECWWTGDDRTWRHGPDLHTGRSFFGSVVLDGTLYALGETTEFWRPGNRAWRVLEVDPPFPRNHFAATTTSRGVFTLGGFPAGLAHARRHDLHRNEPVPTPPFPDFTPGDHLHIVVTLRDSVHVVGGLHNGEPTSAHWKLDGDHWLRCAPAPVPLWAKFSAYAVVHDTLFVFEGEHGLAYDAELDAWHKVRPMPNEPQRTVPPAMPACCVRDEKIIVTGGYGISRARSVRVYDVALDRWSFVDASGRLTVLPSSARTP